MSRSTRLTLAQEHCPRALDYLDAGTPYDRAIFGTGIAAHAVLEGLQRTQHARDNAVVLDEAERIADAVATNLVTKGRTFDGIPEPPLFPADVAPGRDLALRWWNRPRDTAAVPLDWRPEEPIAADRDWRPAKYGPDAYYRGILDVVGPVEEEGFDEYSSGRGLCHTDYKTRWDTNAGELNTIQLRGQSLLVYANAGLLGMVAPSFIRRRVINLRTGMEFHADLWLDDDFDRTVEAWRKDIALAMAHADARGPDQRRIANPGANCIGCPFLLRCDAAQAHWKGTVIEGDPAAIATQYAVVDGARLALSALVKRLAVREPIAVPGGSVGYHGRVTRTPVTDVVDHLTRRWFKPADPETWRAENGKLVSLLETIGITTAAVKRLGVRLFPGKGALKVDGWKELRADLEDEMLTTETQPVFGVERTVPIEDVDEEGVPA